MLSETDQVMRGIVVGLRQIATNMVGQADARMEDTSSEAKGFLAEAVDQYAAGIQTFATDLANAIGYKEPTRELLAARAVAIRQFEEQSAGDAPDLKYVIMDKSGGRRLALDDRGAIIARFTAGQLDGSSRVQVALDGVIAGQALAEREAEERLRTEMLSGVTRKAPDRLTITVDGPPGSGTTWLARMLQREIMWAAYPYKPFICEIRDGRRFDVRNDVFVEG